MESDTDAVAAAAYLSEVQRNEKLVEIRKERDNWKNEAARAANAAPPESELTEVNLTVFIGTMLLAHALRSC